jgi:hypothetical protein
LAKHHKVITSLSEGPSTISPIEAKELKDHEMNLFFVAQESAVPIELHLKQKKYDIPTGTVPRWT